MLAFIVRSRIPTYLSFSKQQHPDHGEEAEVEGQQQNDAVEAGEGAFRTFTGAVLL